ncbi:hypothetical protein A6A40_13145 [Azospirillum humicireducens]|uniref:Uncharacterized protein n=1 Tax=Azospirillum humicireducens TaxID=1226968 RepID=A0A160JI17_9PROT|nr:hypothetical protein [Azospirillum humicireducens]ANC92749.1 hypothetical protein A6A40_13145 [Azospirillum humicireducens]
MTTQSQQQQMAQPDEVRAQGTAGAAGIQQGAAAAGEQEERLVWGGACGAGAGAAILWQPVTVLGSRRR